MLANTHRLDGIITYTIAFALHSDLFEGHHVFRIDMHAFEDFPIRARPHYRLITRFSIIHRVRSCKLWTENGTLLYTLLLDDFCFGLHSRRLSSLVSTRTAFGTGFKTRFGATREDKVPPIPFPGIANISGIAVAWVT